MVVLEGDGRHARRARARLLVQLLGQVPPLLLRHLRAPKQPEILNLYILSPWRLLILLLSQVPALLLRLLRTHMLSCHLASNPSLCCCLAPNLFVQQRTCGPKCALRKSVLLSKDLSQCRHCNLHSAATIELPLSSWMSAQL